MAEDLKQAMRNNYLKYASYVILDRAIPNIDGLKPVQRRILQTLFQIDDGRFHKVANVVGQTMALHPHGDAAINDALINLANKGYLLDRQGNFGNPHTGDPASAARYIETRLSPLAKETVFNPKITKFIPSYDGRNDEPVILPTKIPLLLMHGAEGIAVGMATKVLPHNFTDLINAQIDILEGKEFTLIPDFPTGGIMDLSNYDAGKGKVRVRAKIETPNEKTLVIKEIPPGTNTESVIQSIDDAAKKGKIKIDSINDYTAESVEIEITLPRGQYASQTIDALYAFTSCEVSMHSQVIVIKDNLPWETTTDELLHHHVTSLKAILKAELELERDEIQEKIFSKTLEQIFIENKLYKHIETKATLEEIHKEIETRLKPYHKKLLRVPTQEDRDRLLSIPIRRISRFDLEKNLGEIATLEERLEAILKHLKSIKRYTIAYLKGLLKKYGRDYPRKTAIGTIEEIDKRAISTKKLRVGIDLKGGYVGTKVSSDCTLECTNYDKLLLLFSDGTFSVINVPEKEYVTHASSSIVYAGIADKKTTLNALMKDKNGICFAKRFIVKSFIVGKRYRYCDESMKLEHVTTINSASIKLRYKPKARQKVSMEEFAFSDLLVKGYSARPIRLANKEVKSIKVYANKS